MSLFSFRFSIFKIHLWYLNMPLHVISAFLLSLLKRCWNIPALKECQTIVVTSSRLFYNTAAKEISIPPMIVLPFFPLYIPECRDTGRTSFDVQAFGIIIFLMKSYSNDQQRKKFLWYSRSKLVAYGWISTENDLWIEVKLALNISE